MTQSLDDSTNKTAIYYDLYSQGTSIASIARQFNRSINTVKKYLREHPKYEDPGRGNRLPKSDRTIATRETRDPNIPLKQLTFRCPKELLERIDLVPGRNRKTKYLQAFKLYTLKLPKNRITPKLVATAKDRPISFYCPIEMIDVLDSNKDVDPDKVLSRNQKFIASLEQLCEKYDV